MDRERNRGKVALISGVARGQGRAHALRLSAEGAAIIGFDALHQYETVPYSQASADDLDETVSLVRAQGGEIVACRGDVRVRSDVEDVLAEGMAQFGKVDIIVANAGIGIDSVPFWEVSSQQWDDVVDVNLKGVLNTVSAAAPVMIRQGTGGSVIITSSAAAQMTPPRLAPYTSAKTGVIGLMRTMASELAPHKIRANCVAPTAVPTDFVLNERLFQIFCPDVDNPDVEKVKKIMSNMHPLGEPWVQVEDVAAAVAYLASDEARYVSGTVLSIDLGLSFAW